MPGDKSFYEKQPNSIFFKYYIFEIHTSLIGSQDSDKKERKKIL